MFLNRYYLLSLLALVIPIREVFATTCIESMTCIPSTSPIEVFHAFDVTYGSGMTLLAMALIIGTIEIAIYLRTRSLAMLAVLGIYTVAAFGSIITSSYFSSQYHIMVFVVILGGASVGLIMILKLVKE